jgi:hypothetical protein
LNAANAAARRAKAQERRVLMEAYMDQLVEVEQHDLFINGKHVPPRAGK